MPRNRRLLLSLLSIILVLSALVLPMTAFAQGPTRARSRTITVPWDARTPTHLQVGQIGLAIQPGTFKQIDGDYQLTLTVTEANGHFDADIELSPAHDGLFLKPITAKFGSAKEVEHAGVIYPTRNGKLPLWHFSRYSGWY